MQNLRERSSSSTNLPNYFDILIVGSGAAGLYASLCLPSSYQIGLISKESLNYSSSDWAQGGIAAAISVGDSPNLHSQDTIRAGGGICEPESVKFLVENAAACIDSLLVMGVPFDRKDNELAMTLEAAHSHPRILHSHDTTGQALVEVLKARVLERPNIDVYEQATALDLWLNPQTGRCQGISLLYQRQISYLKAGAVILATGGCGQVFAKTTNPSVSTGDGASLAWRAGAILRDLEFVQFHPTVLTKPGTPRFLISEAVRGEGGHLLDFKGNRFVFDYHPSGELAPRDVVSRAIFSHLTKSANPDYVYLDLRPISPERIRYRFPNIVEKCLKWGIDVFQEPIPVSPAVHYWMGGIAVNLDNSTSIPGLYALGEVASTGVHGANRLASNSLLECLVFAHQLSELKIQHHDPEGVLTIIVNSEDWDGQSMEQIKSLRSDLPDLMWQNAGISRQKKDLESALAQVILWKEKFLSLKISRFLLNLSPDEIVKLESEQAQEQLRTAAEMHNLLDVAYLILKSATFRTESRGGHYRSDYPQTDSAWKVHTLVQNNNCWKSSISEIGTPLQVEV